MAVICLNSHVAYGYVGNDAAAFCLRRLGLEAWQVDTVVYANHPGYGAPAGRTVPAAELCALLDGLAARGAFAACEAVMTGYLADAAQGRAVLHAIDLLRAARPDAPVVVDPIMGDSGPGLYVPRAVATFLGEQVVARADMVTPNAFELGRLTGRSVRGRADAVAAARELSARGPHTVLVTSLPGAAGEVEVLALTRAAGEPAAWGLRVPELHFPVAPNGAGDAMAGLFAAHLLRGRPVADALADSANAVHAVLEATQAAGRRELALVRAQAALADPPRRFRATAL